MSQKGSTQEIIAQKLNTIIALLVDRLPTDSSLSIADKIFKLSDLGVPAGQIGSIISKPVSYVTATLHRRKHRKVKK